MTILFLLKGYPRLSETFIAQEIRALEERGINIKIVSLRFPTDKKTHPIVAEIKAPVSYLPEYLYQEPLRVLRGWWKARKLTGYNTAFRQWWKDFQRDRTANRIRRFGQALVLASELPSTVTHLHAHFLHTPASVADYAHLLTGLPWTCSAHAKDIWTIPEWEKKEKLDRMQWLVTCTQSGARHLQDIANEPKKIALVYHGLDFQRFPEPPERRPQGPILLLSVGRAVEKKGYDDLLAALALLPPDLDWRFRHIGGGPLGEALKQKAISLGLEDRISWQGPRTQGEILEEYRKADLFILASKIAKDGDRDGLPNVLMEAQSQKVPVLATHISGIPELILEGETGWMAEPNDPASLSKKLDPLIRDRDALQRVGLAGYRRVRENFSLDRGIEDLERRFRGAK